MKSTAQKLIVISFILALFAAVSAYLFLQSFKAPKEVNKKINVLVATETIPPRTFIDKKMIKEIQVSEDSILANYIEDASKIVGKYTKETVFKDEGFYADRLLDKDSNELSLKIDSNHRAISISVSGDTGVSDLLKPGDSVDVITFIAEKKDGNKIINPNIAKTILQNIEILAVDKQLNREEKTNTKEIDKEKTLTNFLVTLSIPTSDIEKLVLGQSIGSIKLALRPLKDDNNTSSTNGATLEELYLNVNSNNDNTVADKENNANILNKDNEKYKNYTVKPGDTLQSISREFYKDEHKYTIIKEANNIENENLIVTGEIIKIPILQ